MPRIGLSNFFLRDAELVDRELVIAAVSSKSITRACAAKHTGGYRRISMEVFPQIFPLRHDGFATLIASRWKSAIEAGEGHRIVTVKDRDLPEWLRRAMRFAQAVSQARVRFPRA